MEKKLKNVLILNGQYVPGFKGGGPIRSIENIVNKLHDKFNFYIITSDKDFGETQPYKNIKHFEWNTVGFAKVYYLTDSEQKLINLLKVINKEKFQVLYLNGFFALQYTIKALILRKLGLIKFEKVILSPRGDFSEGILKIKKIKKRVYIILSKIFKLYNNILWQASSEYEVIDIKRTYGKNISTFIAPNLAGDYNKGNKLNLRSKEKGKLRITFLSRISPKKNLLGALEILKCINGDVVFDIYGSLEDSVYWDSCKKVIEHLPSNIKVNYKGEISHDRVISIIKEYHLFFFPTFGENFGHVILEAFIGGCPVLISDQTPWRDLSSLNVGWDINNENRDEYVKVLQYMIGLSNEEFNVISQSAYEYGIQKSMDTEKIVLNEKMFSFDI